MPNGTLTLPDWVRPSGSVPNWAMRMTPQNHMGAKPLGQYSEYGEKGEPSGAIGRVMG